MRIIAFTNQKGGVGKTTSVLNIGAGLVAHGKKVLLIDLDPQGNLTQSLLPAPPQNTVFTVLLEECELQEGVMALGNGLSLIPCNAKFANFERQFAADANSQYVLTDLVEDIKETYPGEFDYIIMDTPPALGLITLNALVAAKEIYVPMNSQEFSLTGLKAVMEVVTRVKKRVNKELKVSGLFFTQHNPRKYISRNMAETLNEDYPGLLMETYVRKNVALEESPSLRQDVFKYDPDSNGAKDYMQLTKEIMGTAK